MGAAPRLDLRTPGRYGRIRRNDLPRSDHDLLSGAKIGRTSCGNIVAHNPLRYDVQVGKQLLPFVLNGPSRPVHHPGAPRSCGNDQPDQRESTARTRVVGKPCQSARQDTGSGRGKQRERVRRGGIASPAHEVSEKSASRNDNDDQPGRQGNARRSRQKKGKTKKPTHHRQGQQQRPDVSDRRGLFRLSRAVWHLVVWGRLGVAYLSIWPS